MGGRWSYFRGDGWRMGCRRPFRVFLAILSISGTIHGSEPTDINMYVSRVYVRGYLAGVSHHCETCLNEQRGGEISRDWRD